VSYSIAVSMHDPVWVRLAEALRARRNELLLEAVDLGATDQARRDASVRVDEISLLIDAPRETLEKTIASHQGAGDKRGVY